MATDIRTSAIEYPDTDGQPMAETDTHYRVLVDTRERLSGWYAGRQDVYVSGNLLVYYVEGDPQVSLAPDGFVVFGVPPNNRDTYKVWEEGKYPDVVFEFTSKSTKRDDLNKKLLVYQDIWRVKEYFLFDPLDEYLDPPLLGYRLVRGKFRPIAPTDGVLTSRMLGITLEREGPRLILRDVVSGDEVLTADEAARHIAEAEAATERAARLAAEAEVAQLKAELAALRKRKPSA